MRPFAVSARLLFLAGVLWFLPGAALSATGNDEPPYQAVVAQPMAKVYSGAGRQYYATAELAEGSPVEVYGSSGGFLAIRPPEGSFSWAPAADVELTGAGIGVVKRDGVASRVGSAMSEQKNVVHVRLQEGERVRVLASAKQNGVEWLQIAPPSGEFRWVRDVAVRPADGLHEPAPLVLKTKPAPIVESPLGIEPPQTPELVGAAEPISEWIQAAGHEQTGGFGAEPVLEEAPPFAPPVAAPTMQPTTTLPASALPATTPPPANTPPTPAPQPSTAQPSATPAYSPQSQASRSQTSPTLVASPSVPPAETAPAGSGNFAKRLSALEVELARRIAQPAHLWNLEGVEVDAARLLTIAGNPEQSEAARALASRAGRFAEIAARHRQPLPSNPPTVARIAPNPPAAAAIPPTLAPSDTIGELRQVVSKRPDAPKFAVIDSQGRVISFVSPQLGMDLLPLVGKQVSVTGVQGYMPELRSRHVTATRVAQTPPLVR